MPVKGKNASKRGGHAGDVLARLASCGPGQVRNPRTDRCLKASGPTGRALAAAAEAMRSGGHLPACRRGVHDHASGRCTTERYRAEALRVLWARYGTAVAANRRGRGRTTTVENTASIARAMTSAALLRAVKNDSAARERAAAGDLAEAGRSFDALASYVDTLRENGASKNAEALWLGERLAAAEARRDAAEAGLRACRQTLDLAQRELLRAANGRA